MVIDVLTDLPYKLERRELAIKSSWNIIGQQESCRWADVPWPIQVLEIAHQDWNLASLQGYSQILSCSHGEKSPRLRDKFGSDFIKPDHLWLDRLGVVRTRLFSACGGKIVWSMIYSVSVPSATMLALQSDCFMWITSCTAIKATKEGQVVEVLCRRLKVPRLIEGFKFCASLFLDIRKLQEGWSL